MTFKILIRGALVMLVSTVSPLPNAPAFAYQSQSKAAINLDAENVALRGFDPVAYFILNKPTPGLAAFTATHDGATYQFASAEHQALFSKEPTRFAPQFGGFCAFAAAKGYKADADPKVWNITSGKLYVNYNAAVGKTWSLDKARMITDAMTKWATTKDAPAN